MVRVGGGIAPVTAASQGRVQLKRLREAPPLLAGRARLGLDRRGSLGVPASASSSGQKQNSKVPLDNEHCIYSEEEVTMGSR